MTRGDILITHIEVERFKSIRSINLELGRVNIFIGGNGSGKSNFLEAIGILSAALGRGLSDSEFRRKGVRITPPALLKSAFKNFDLPKTFTLKARANHGIEYYCALSSSETETSLFFSHEKCTKNKQKIFARSPKGASALTSRLKRNTDKYRGIWDQTQSFFDYDPDIVDELNKIAHYAIYSPQTEFLRGRKVGAVDTPPIGLHGEGLSNAVKTLLTDYVRMQKSARDSRDPEFDTIKKLIHLPFTPGWASSVRSGQLSEITVSSDMEILNENMVYFVDKFMHAKRNKLSAYDSSEGTLFLLFASVLLAHKDSPKIFAFDNVDSALNPNLTKKLLSEIIDAIKEKKEHAFPRCPEQIFLTSHNPTSLDAFDIFDPDTRIFVVARAQDGETKINRLEPPPGMEPSLWHEASGGRRLSEMWIDGEINGALGRSI